MTHHLAPVGAVKRTVRVATLLAILVHLSHGEDYGYGDEEAYECAVTSKLDTETEGTFRWCIHQVNNRNASLPGPRPTISFTQRPGERQTVFLITEQLPPVTASVHIRGEGWWQPNPDAPFMPRIVLTGQKIDRYSNISGS